MLSVIFLSTVGLVLSYFMGPVGFVLLNSILGIRLMMFMMSSEGVLGLSTVSMYDGMSLSLSFLSVWISVLTLLAMNTGQKEFFFFSFFSFMMLCMLLFSFMLYNLFGFYFFFEAVLIPMVMMIYMWGNQPERVAAGLYMLMYTLFGSLPLLFILIYLSRSNSISFVFLMYFKVEDLNFFFAFLLIFAFLVKMPMFMFHLWLPKAHVEAPISGSMLLAGVLLKLGGYGFYRVYCTFSYCQMHSYDYLVMAISILGAVFIGFVCLRQTDIKALIAYSSVCHMGLVIGGLFSGSLIGSYGVLVMMLGHGLCSSALFCLANFIYERFYTRNLLLMKGMTTVFSMLTFWWFTFCVINMGAPPFMNLFGEVLLLVSLLKWDFYTMFLLSFISFLSASYSLYLFSFSQHGKSWHFYSIIMISQREYILLCGHLFPLGLYIFKSELFSNWC